VTEIDGRSQPRIIDFGLALPAVAGAEHERLTQVGQFVGTPGYLSPEGVAGGGAEIDTRSDVYALGVVLYVLLTGLRPYDPAPGIALAAREWLAQLRSGSAPPPSAKLEGLHGHLEAIGAARMLGARKLIAALRGDLDAIAAKALAKERADRYRSPAELAGDLNRYLQWEPVTARPPTFAYLLGRSIRRHRMAALLIALIALFLASAVVTQSVNAARLSRERARVVRERDHAVMVTNLLVGMFKAPAAGAGADPLSARQVLDGAAAQLRQESLADPDAEAQALHLLARAYLNLGELESARDTAQYAFDLRLKLHGPDDPATLESMAQLGWILDQQGNGAEAERLEREALARERHVLPPANALTLETMHKLARILTAEGHADEAATIMREWNEKQQALQR
jgi:eukaryotic-like serine/threonine-protein kinase